MRAARRVPALLAAAVLGSVLTPLAATSATAGSLPPPASEPRAQREWQRPSTGRLQVRFKPGTGEAAQRAALARVADRGHAVAVDRRIARLGAAILRTPNARAVQALLRRDPSVLYVEPESRYEAFAEPVSPELAETGANALHTFPGTPVTGAGTEIAIIDSPVNASNPDLDGAGKVVDAGDFTTPIGLDPNDPWQTTDTACGVLTCPHGTAVAAVAAAEADDANMVGVAPGAVIRSYNVFRLFHFTNPMTEEEGYDVGAASGDIAAALDALATYAAANQQLVAVNMSLGGTFDNHLIRDAIAALRAAAPQVTVVVAAGNDGAERPTFPAGDPGVISVGATGQPLDGNACDATPSGTWTLASFSNRGDVDIVAPGQCVFSWYTPDAAGGNAAATVQKVDGTSFAAPMVAGTAALLASASPAVTGDAARAAMVASAKAPTTTVFGNGVGALDAVAALALAQGTAPYTAAFVERGGHVASNVGRRNVEVLRVDRDGPTPAPATITVPSGNGVLAGLATQATSTLTRSSVTWFAPKVNKAGLSFGLTAAGGTGGDDTTVVPFRYLDAADNFEGLPIPNNEQTSVALTYGTRSAYIRSAHVEDELDWTFQFDPHGWDNTAQLYTWEPTTSDGVADAAFEPTFAAVDESELYYVIPDVDQCDSEGRPCYRGRYLIGWMLASPDDNSVGTSRYNLKLNYPGPGVTLTAPSLASAVSSTGPFTVSWGGSNAVTFDVEYTTKVKVGSNWVLGAWKPWLTNTPLKSKVFGASNLPVALAKGQTYHFRLRSYDMWLNPSPYVSKYTVVPLDDAYYAFAYAGTWGKGGATGRWASNVHYSSSPGASLTAKSETSQFTVIGDKCAACGQIRVYIDGVLKATVDTRASGTLVRQPLWTSANLGAPKAHTLKIVVVGTAGRPKVVIDAIGSLR